MDALIGITGSNLVKLLGENKFAVDPQYWSRMFRLFYLAGRNSYFLRQENRLYKDKISQGEIQPPVFVLGHWRSGTTLLHSLLSLDQQFAYPTLFQVSKPYIFLVREPEVAKIFEGVSAQKRPMDNIQVTFNSPGEDEFALAVGSLRSPLIGWTFTRREAFYDRFLSFKDASDKEIDEWKDFFIWFMKKLSYRYPGKRIILKSPTHTARIKLLLEMFPGVKFVHIHRNPEDVFRSTLKLYKDAVPRSYLQKPVNEDFENSIINRYKILYDAFFEDKALLSENQLCEVSFEELEGNMEAQINRIYQELDLPGYETFKPELVAYLEKIKNYQKNTYEPIATQTREKLYQACPRCFQEWGY
jgi:hypothetical protein